MSDQILAKHYDVFLSYKRVDDAAREILCDALENAGFEYWYDGKMRSGNFRHQIRDEINRCDVVIAIWSLQANENPREVIKEMDQAYGMRKLVAVRIDDAPIPQTYEEENFLPFDRWEDEKARKEQLVHIIESVKARGTSPNRIVTIPIPTTIPVELSDGFPAEPPKLIGRDREMQLLYKAWNGGTNAVVLHALGGAGKSALLRAFVNERLAKGGDGAERIYGWSAYSQGSGEQKHSNADGFISRALIDFGYDGKPIRDGVERARTLAQLIQHERTLLLLDGLEPMQYPPNLNKGRFKDKPLATLIKILGNMNPGLMVLTSRQEVSELAGTGGLVVHHPLDELSEEAGAELLVELGATGRNAELKAAVRDVKGHALSVTLLGTFVTEVCGGDIRKRDRFEFGKIIDTPEELENTDKTLIPAKRAEKVMKGYLKQFDKLAEGAVGLGGPERALLHLLGLFDRPADGPAVELLLSDRIEGLTDGLFFERSKKNNGFFGLFPTYGLKEITKGERVARLREAKSRLRKLRLLANSDPNDPHALDAHPIVRSYFAIQLDKVAPIATKLAHEKLYRHYASTAPFRPNTLEEMIPLFHAVSHGVKAGLANEAFLEIFWKRILRENDRYLQRMLGALGAELDVLSNFFDSSWSEPLSELPENFQAFSLNETAFSLTTLGRLHESLLPREAGIAMRVSLRDWENAARASEMLSDTQLIIGNVSRAIEAAEQSVNYIDNSGVVSPQREFSRTALANAVFEAGELERAKELFSEAEIIRAKRHPDSPQLISVQGYQFGNLLLAYGRIEEAYSRGKRQLIRAKEYLGEGLGLHDIGFSFLLVGQAESALNNPEATVNLDNAVEWIRKSGMEHRLPEALLARAKYRRVHLKDGENTLLKLLLDDLTEVEGIAEPEMRLYLTDLALERARLALTMPATYDNPLKEATHQTQIAAEFIQATGYHRRDNELAELQMRLSEA